jgi:hypothetical protein
MRFVFSHGIGLRMCCQHVFVQALCLARCNHSHVPYVVRPTPASAGRQHALIAIMARSLTRPFRATRDVSQASYSKLSKHQLVHHRFVQSTRYVPCLDARLHVSFLISTVLALSQTGDGHFTPVGYHRVLWGASSLQVSSLLQEQLTVRS